MNEQFLPYDLAVQLKELGFDEECFATFSFSNKKLSGLPLEDMEGKPCNALEYTWKNSEIHSTNTAAPLWQQAFDWFRDEYNYHASIYRMNNKWSSQVYDVERGCYITKYVLFDTYQEARQACLEKLIEICKKKE